jgi:NADP-dependent 3-hydroxy acid dehydrogenase YdfG
MKMEDLTGRIAVITGASSGIGEAAACLLVAEGMKVVLVARREDRIRSLPLVVCLGPPRVDLARSPSRRRMAGVCAEQTTGVDVNRPEAVAPQERGCPHSGRLKVRIPSAPSVPGAGW